MRKRTIENDIWNKEPGLAELLQILAPLELKKVPKYSMFLFTGNPDIAHSFITHLSFVPDTICASSGDIKMYCVHVASGVKGKQDLLHIMCDTSCFEMLC
jgi:hypothetical protein